MKVVVNSTPLIVLSLVDKLSLLKEIFSEVIVPKSVFEEVAVLGKGRPGSEEVKAATWLTLSEPQDRGPLPPSLSLPHPGKGFQTVLRSNQKKEDLSLLPSSILPIS